MSIKIVSDSSSDVLMLEGVDYASVPLTIITDVKEYVDKKELDVEEMAAELKVYKGKSSTACPGVGDWLDAFEGADEVIAITITGNLSGSYNAACLAKRDYEEEHPGSKVHVINSLSAGPELALIIEKLVEYIKEGKAFEEICDLAAEYMKNTKLLFFLESMANLANNGRVSPLVAKAAGLLGIRALGQASDEGTLEMLDKCRGENKALSGMVKYMKDYGYKGGKVSIGHCANENAALKLKDLILKEFPEAKVEYHPLRALCSFYAEQGGVLLGYEI